MEKKIYIRPDCEEIVISASMSDVDVKNLSGDRWTFTRENAFEEEEQQDEETPQPSLWD